MTGRAEQTGDRVAEIRERLAAATPGPWHWRNSTEPLLMGARTKLVMAFARMGMNGAQPEFRSPDGLMEKAGKANLHADYADSVLIANAPADLAYLLAELEDARAKLANVKPLAEDFDLRARAFTEGSPGHDAWKSAASALRAALHPNQEGQGND